jgi:DNA ligase-4
LSKQPLSLPAPLFIFNKLEAHGFHLSQWVYEYPEERVRMLQDIVDLMEAGKLEAPECEVVDLSSESLSDEEAGAKVREATQAMLKGYSSKKFVLKFH